MQSLLLISTLLLCSKLATGTSAQSPFFRGKAAKAETRTTAREVEAETTQATSSSFGTALFSELYAEYPHENILISPLSVSLALILVKYGATRGSECNSELKQVLGPKSVQEQAISLQQQSEEGYETGNVMLDIATSIWSDSLKSSYISKAQRRLSSETFSLPESYGEIDEWIEEKTKGMITELMGDEPLDPLTVALLVNVVHFKGTWTNQFEKSDTIDGMFTLADGSEVPARYMTAHRDDVEVITQSEELGGAAVLVLDYGELESDSDPEFSSIFILPPDKDEESMKQVISGLNSYPLSEILADTSKTEVKLQLPRFRLEFGPSKLKPFLQNMGIEDAFDKTIRSKFNRMSSDSYLYVDDVHHGACMEVAEEGTKAAAATVVEMFTRGRPRIFELNFNHPFIMIVYHHQTGIPVFIGKVENPDFFF